TAVRIGSLSQACPARGFSTIPSMNSPLPSSFVHLRVHSEFSVVDGIVRIPELVKQVARFGQPAVALTDLVNLFGLIKFYKAARHAGVKPIAGCDLWLENEVDKDKPHRVLILVRNHTGYLNLCDLITRAWLDNRRAGRAEVRRQRLVGLEGVLLLSRARAGDVGQALEAGKPELARHLAQQWPKAYPGAYYIELQRVQEADENYVQAAM